MKISMCLAIQLICSGFCVLASANALDTVFHQIYGCKSSQMSDEVFREDTKQLHNFLSQPSSESIKKMTPIMRIRLLTQAWGRSELPSSLFAHIKDIEKTFGIIRQSAKELSIEERQSLHAAILQDFILENRNIDDSNLPEILGKKFKSKDEMYSYLWQEATKNDPRHINRFSCEMIRFHSELKIDQKSPDASIDRPAQIVNLLEFKTRQMSGTVSPICTLTNCDGSMQNFDLNTTFHNIKILAERRASNLQSRATKSEKIQPFIPLKTSNCNPKNLKDLTSDYFSLRSSTPSMNEYFVLTDNGYCRLTLKFSKKTGKWRVFDYLNRDENMNPKVDSFGTFDDLVKILKGRQAQGHNLNGIPSVTPASSPARR